MHNRPRLITVATCVLSALAVTSVLSVLAATMWYRSLANTGRLQQQASITSAERTARLRAPAQEPEGGKVYSGESLTDIAMPLGGIGAGNIAIGGRGDLREWQIFNVTNSDCAVPGGFFAIGVDGGRSQPVVRVLQTMGVGDLPPVRAIQFRGEYPIAQVEYRDDGLPVHVTLEAFSPFIPMNEEDSALPAIIFNFTVLNPLKHQARVMLLASCQNAVGYDGYGAITAGPRGAVYFPGYGGNLNTVVRGQHSLAVAMTAPDMKPDEKHFGSMSLLTTAPGAAACPEWTGMDQLRQALTGRGSYQMQGKPSPSARGSTANCAVMVPLMLLPGEKKAATFVLTWHFPNRYADYRPSALCSAVGDTSRYRLGNMYHSWFADAGSVAQYVVANRERLTTQTRLFHDTFYDSNLPYWLLDCVSSQISTLRSQTVMWIEDGTLAGFEGSNCCPMNCTHVWNYEQTLAKLFPSLERNMRNTDFGVQQDSSGFIHHRTVLPLSLPRASGPFADGHLGSIMKAYREYLQCPKNDWLLSKWKRIRLAIDWAIEAYDPRGNGVIEGKQDNTYDCAIHGANTFIGTWYLGALRSAEEMARVAGDSDSAKRYRILYRKGRSALDRSLWNGEYYIQSHDGVKHPPSYGDGCLSDQLVGQWFAQVVGLGHLLPEDHVKSALKAIVKHNFVWDASNVPIPSRVFAAGHDMGLLNCTWPQGKQPDDPIYFHDEVWTGVEYQVASHLIWEGMVNQGLQLAKAARDRYNGIARPPFQRNPWNEIECGEHYARAMSSWALLLAMQGYEYNGPNGAISFSPRWRPEDHRSFFTTAEGWGTFQQKRTAGSQVDSLSLRYGWLTLREVRLTVPQTEAVRRIKVDLNGTSLAAGVASEDGFVVVRLGKPITLTSGDTLSLQLVVH